MTTTTTTAKTTQKPSIVEEIRAYAQELAKNVDDAEDLQVSKYILEALNRKDLSAARAKKDEYEVKRYAQRLIKNGDEQDRMAGYDIMRALDEGYLDSARKIKETYEYNGPNVVEAGREIFLRGFASKKEKKKAAETTTTTTTTTTTGAPDLTTADGLHKYAEGLAAKPGMIEKNAGAAILAALKENDLPVATAIATQFSGVGATFVARGASLPAAQPAGELEPMDGEDLGSDEPSANSAADDAEDYESDLSGFIEADEEEAGQAAALEDALAPSDEASNSAESMQEDIVIPPLPDEQPQAPESPSIPANPGRALLENALYPSNAPPPPPMAAVPSDAFMQVLESESNPEQVPAPVPPVQISDDENDAEANLPVLENEREDDDVIMIDISDEEDAAPRVQRRVMIPPVPPVQQLIIPPLPPMVSSPAAASSRPPPVTAQRPPPPEIIDLDVYMADARDEAPVTHFVTADQDFDASERPGQPAAAATTGPETPAKWTFVGHDDRTKFKNAKKQQQRLDALVQEEQRLEELVQDPALSDALLEARKRYQEANQRYLERQIKKDEFSTARLSAVQPPPIPQAILTSERYAKAISYNKKGKVTGVVRDDISFHTYVPDQTPVLPDVATVSEREGHELEVFERVNAKMLRRAKKNKLDEFFDIAKKPKPYNAKSDDTMIAKHGWTDDILYKISDVDNLWDKAVLKRYYSWLSTPEEFLGKTEAGLPKAVVWAPMVYEFRSLLAEWIPVPRPVECQIVIACLVKEDFQGKDLKPSNLDPIFAMVIGRNMMQSDDSSQVYMNVLEVHSFKNMTTFASVFPIAMQWFRFAFTPKLTPRQVDVDLHLTLTVSDAHLGTFLRYGFHISGQTGFTQDKDGVHWLHRLHGRLKSEKWDGIDVPGDIRGGGNVKLPTELFTDQDLLRLALSKFDDGELRDGFVASMLRETAAETRVPGTKDPQPALRASQNATSLLEIITANQEDLTVLLDSFAENPELTRRGRAFLTSYLSEGQEHANLQSFLLFRALDNKWPRGPTLVGYAFLAFSATGFWIYGLETFAHASDPMFSRRCLRLLLDYCRQAHLQAVRMVPDTRKALKSGVIVDDKATPRFRFARDIANFYIILGEQYDAYEERSPVVNFLVRRKDKFLRKVLLPDFGFIDRATSSYEGPYVRGKYQLTRPEMQEVLIFRKTVNQGIPSSWIPARLPPLERINPTLQGAAAPRTPRLDRYQDTVATVVTFT